MTAITSALDDTELSCTTSRAIAIDLGGSHIRCGLVGHQSILSVFDHPISPKSRLAPLLPVLEHHVAGFARNGDCRAIAIAFPGIVTRDGKVLSTPRGKFDDAPDIDLAAWAKERFGLRLVMENDARMALLGERFAGAARGCDDIVMMTLGTGVGAAAMMEGRLIRGKHFQGGCLGGHLPVVWNGRRCICGNLGCVEAEASTWALPEICACWPQYADSALACEPRINFETLFRCARDGDAAASQIRERCLRIWAAGIVGLIHSYDPERVVLGGAVMGSADDILPPLREHVRAHAWTPWGEVEIRAGELGSEAGLWGAIPLLSETC